jgi:hypothetical protein
MSWRNSYNRRDNDSGFWPGDVAAGVVGGAVGHRPIGAIMGKASRLRRDSVLPAGRARHAAVFVART